MQERAEEIKNAAALHLDRDRGSILFVTLTSRNTKADSLKSLWTATTDAWRKIWQGQAAMDLRADLGIVGSIRAFEVTYGGNGWHPHLHVMMFFDRQLTDAERALLDEWLFKRWAAGIEAHGFDRPRRFTRHADGTLRPVAVVIEQVTSAGVGDYLSKLSEASSPELELARGDLKTGRKDGQRSPWQVLADTMKNGDTQDLAIWHDFERVSKGRNALTWTPGLKARFAVEEVTDDEIAERAEAGDTLVEMPLNSWGHISKRRGGVTEVLESLETRGASDTVLLVQSWGLLAWCAEGTPQHYDDQPLK